MSAHTPLSGSLCQHEGSVLSGCGECSNRERVGVRLIYLNCVVEKWGKVMRF